MLSLICYLLSAPMLFAGVADHLLDPWYQPCSGADWFGGFQLTGEFIYQRPCTADFSFIVTDIRASDQLTSGSLPQGRSHTLGAQFEPGFRVGVGYLTKDACRDARLTVSGFFAKETSYAAAPELGVLWATFGVASDLGWLGMPFFSKIGKQQVITMKEDGRQERTEIDAVLIRATAKGRFSLQYGAADLELGACRMCSCDLWIRSFIGIHYLDTVLRRNVRYSGFYTTAGDQPHDAEILTKAETWATGPRLGVDLRYDVACGLGVGLHVSGGLLAGSASNRWKQRLSPLPRIPIPIAKAGDSLAVAKSNAEKWSDKFEQRFGPWSRPPAGKAGEQQTESQQLSDIEWLWSGRQQVVIPMINYRLGINYLYCSGGCYYLISEIGWEATTYFNAFKRDLFVGSGATGFSRCEMLSFSGLYVNFRLQF